VFSRRVWGALSYLVFDSSSVPNSITSRGPNNARPAVKMQRYVDTH